MKWIIDFVFFFFNAQDEINFCMGLCSAVKPSGQNEHLDLAKQ